MVHHGYGKATGGMMNLNGHVLCSIDTETTGLTAGYNDIIEVAVIPLGPDLTPMKNVVPFTTLIKPKDRHHDSWTEEAAKVHGIKREDLMLHGLEAWRAADLFEEWFTKLALAPGKKIAPLAWNWRFDAGFINDWLAPKTFNSLIWHRVRDGMSVVQFFNDKAELDGRKPPFPQTSLQSVRTRLDVAPTAAHRAVGDALVTAAVYKKLIDFDPTLLPSAGSTELSK